MLISIMSVAQNGEAYKIYSGQGKKVSYKKMIKQLNKNDVIFFGELHDNPISHWLQVEVTQSLMQTDTLVLGAEMIEADNQEELTNYLTGKIDERALDTLARLWPNHSTDYAPLLRIAKDQQLSFVATNIPRRYASMVYKNGFEALDSLTPLEKSWIAPLPILFDPELPRYKNILKMMGNHGTPELIKAQAIKDATMAHFILENIKSNSIFIHYNGAYHSDFHEGIVWYINQSNPEIRVITISTVSQQNLKRLDKEHFGKADFIICVAENMTSTY